MPIESVGDDRGRAIAYHNLGMVSADRELWDDADGYFQRSLELAESTGDVHLRGLGLLNHSEVHLARQRYELARQNAESALAVFDQLGSKLDKADAYKVIGRVYRETGRHALAEARLPLGRGAGRGHRLGAERSGGVARAGPALPGDGPEPGGAGPTQRRPPAVQPARRPGRPGGRVDQSAAGCEDTYLTVVREWGQSIESSDSYTFGHCERVAGYGVALAQALGLDEAQQTTIRIGAYLHDLGKVKVPHEILNKPGRLTDEEFGVIQMHPVWGVEMLATVEFPWDIKPIIRWHHERYEGDGYPDRLRGDEIPLNAQIICIVDVYDALTTTRSYRGAMSSAEALARLAESKTWWRPDVYEGFLQSLGEAREAA